jgi:co-chaperonin GroES (HSP10)
MPETETQIELVRREGNVFWAGATGVEARGERIAILKDEHLGGNECPRCLDKKIRSFGEGGNTRQVSMIDCPECNGKGERPKVGNPDLVVKCSECGGAGDIPCPECKGKGTKEGIVIPEDRKSEPMTGEVVSVGADTKVYKIGDRVLFPSYAGHQSTFTVREKKTNRKEVVILRFINEGDVIAQLYGELEMRSFDGTQALYTNE